MCPIRVLLVDDSAFMRRQLKRVIDSCPDLKVIDTARNGQEAVDKAKELEPDVITLDINMPEMDGLTALTYIMMERPTPVVVISSLTQEGALATFEALELGAFDFVAKPSGTISLDIAEQETEIVEKVRAAARARLRKKPATPLAAKKHKPVAPATLTSARPAQPVPGHQALVVMGVSTGGPTTLLDILPKLPADLPVPVALVQHMPPSFTAGFARRLDQQCSLDVKEAEQNEPLLPGHVYLAPGGYQMTITASLLGRGLVTHLSDRPKGLQFCPSVDVLFESVAEAHGRRIVGVLLTGMGSDGARAWSRSVKAGGITIAESEETAIVFGMPREAITMGGAEIVAPSTKIAEQIQAALRRIL